MKLNKTIGSTILLLATAVLTAGCQEDETRDVRFEIDTTEVKLTNGEAGSTDILIASNYANPTAVVDESAQEWLSTKIVQRCLTLIYTRNDSGAERTARIYLTAGNIEKTVTLTQPVYIDPADGYVVGDQIEEGAGIIYWTDPTDPTIAKAVSVARTTGLAWSSDTSASGAGSFTNGAENAEYLNNEKFAAAYYCSQLGEGWYLPARDELIELFEAYNGTSAEQATIEQPGKISSAEKSARAAFDAYLAAAGGDPMNSGGESENGNSYWSSTEYELDASQAYFVRFGKYVYEPISKTSSTRYVRCIKVLGDYSYGADPIAMTCSPSTVSLEGAQGSAQDVTVSITNGTLASVEVDAANRSWCSASVNGNTITITATENNTTGASRQAEVTVTATSTTGAEPVSEIIVVTQKQFVENGYKIGELYTENEKAVGVVFWVSDDGQTAKIVSLNRTASTVAWSKAGTTWLGAASEDNGVENTSTIMASAEAADVPALESCTDGWYWPAINELKQLFEAYNGTTFDEATNANPNAITDAEKEARAAFDQLLTDNGGTPLNTADESGTGDQYWASTEFDEANPAYAMYLRFGKPYCGSVADTPKKNVDSKRYVRWIKQIGKEAQSPVNPGTGSEKFSLHEVVKESGQAVGIVFWVSDNGQTAKIVSLDRTASTIAWSAIGQEHLGATDENDGAVNTEILKLSAESESIPMLDFCAQHGEGWYWPAINELKQLFEAYNGTTFDEATNANPNAITDAEKEARAAFDQLLTDNGGTPLNTADESGTGDQYWASTEFDEANPAYAMYLRFGKPYCGTVADTPKKNADTKRYGRCIKLISK